MKVSRAILSRQVPALRSWWVLAAQDRTASKVNVRHPGASLDSHLIEALLDAFALQSPRRRSIAPCVTIDA